MQNLETQIQNETPETGAEYLRRLAGDIRVDGQTRTAFDIEAAADKIDQQAAEIESLREKAARSDAAAIRSADALDAVLSPLFSALEPRIEALAEQVAERVARDAAREEIENLEISDFDYEIGEMIDDRLPDAPDEDDQREAVESIVREILAGATVSIDI
jgi:hypothetical protein